MDGGSYFRDRSRTQNSGFGDRNRSRSTRAPRDGMFDDDRPKALLALPSMRQPQMSMQSGRQSLLGGSANSYGGSSFGSGQNDPAPSMRERQLMQLLQQQQQALANLEMSSAGAFASSNQMNFQPTNSGSSSSYGMTSRLSSSRQSNSGYGERGVSSRETRPRPGTDGFEVDDSRRVFVGFEHQETYSYLEKDDLLEVFEDFGPVVGIRVAPNGKYGFVSFEHVTAANDAVDSLDQTSFTKAGPIMKVEHVTAKSAKPREREYNRESRPRPRRDAVPSVPISKRITRAPTDLRTSSVKRGRDDSRSDYPKSKRFNREPLAGPTAYLGFINKLESYEMSDDEIWKAFQPFGDISKCKAANSKKYAFISFENEKDCKSAIESLNNGSIKKGGPKMRVEWVRSEEREDSNMKTVEDKKPAVKSKFADITAKAHKVIITKIQEKEMLEIEIPPEVLYCCICDFAKFDTLKSYIGHIKSAKHATSRYLSVSKNKMMYRMLSVAADLADYQKEAKLSVRRGETYPINAAEDTAERKAYVRNQDKPNCKICTVKFSIREEYLDHVCTILHQKLAHDKDQKVKTGATEADSKEFQLEKLVEKVEEAKDSASLSPISLENQPLFDAEETFGMEKMEQTGGFYCATCSRDLTIPEVEKHCKSYGHYQKIIDELKKKKADEVSAAAALLKKEKDENGDVNGDAGEGQYTVVDEATDDGQKDQDMKSPQTGDLEGDEEDDAEEEEEEKKNAADYMNED